MVRTNYCTYCDKPPVDPHATVFARGKAKVEDLTSRLATHLNSTKKVIKAHPLASALIATAFLTCVVATVIFFSTGFPLGGVSFMLIGGIVLAGGSFLLSHEREEIDVKEFKKRHALNNPNTTARIQNNKKVCLVLEGTYDPNSAYKREKGPAKWEKKYSLVHVQVSSIEEVDNAIRQVKQFADIQVLWFSAHGDKEGIQLSQNNSIDLDNAKSLAKSFRLLDPNATIFLDGCKTANTPKNQPEATNIAKKISAVAKRRVLGSNVSTTSSGLRLKMKREATLGIQVSRWGSKRSNRKEKVQDYTCAITAALTPCFIGKHFEKSALRVYDNGSLNQNIQSKYVVV